MKKISIIIPCYNVEEYIDRCVMSLVGQTIGVEALELIFVDDASTDGTWQKLCQWEAKYPDSVMLIHNEENIKQGGVRNIGLSYASADYIGFVDADDWVELSMYEKMYGKAVANAADIVYCHSKRDWGSEPLKMGRTGKEDAVYYRETYEQKVLALVGGYGTGVGIWGGLYTRSLVLDHDIFFPERLAYEDNYWSALIGMYAEKIYILEEYLYHYFVNLDSTVCQQNAEYHLDRLKVEEMLLNELVKRGFYEEFAPEFEKRFIEMYYCNTMHLIFTRFQSMPLEVILSMQSRVRSLFPKYMENLYLKNKVYRDYQGKAWNILFESLGKNLTVETIKEDCLRYRAELHNQGLL